VTIAGRAPRYQMRIVLMICTNCGRTKMRSYRGWCNMCGEGMMVHVREAVPMRIYAEETKRESDNAPTPE
jgi:NMD protein affecting ribosome stability and mRNA decay